MDSLFSSLTWSGILLVAVAAVIHATFQLSVSVLTLMSGHTLGRQASHLKLIRRGIAYTLGSIVAVILACCMAGFIIAAIPLAFQPNIWVILAVLSAVMGVMICFAYYRPGKKGTALWIPRSFADYLMSRAKKTKHSTEASILGATSIIAELPLTIGLIFIAAMALRYSPAGVQLAAFTLYAVVAALPLIIIVIMLGGGHKLSTIQSWREQNKSFLRYGVGCGMIALTLYVISFYILEAHQL